MTFDKLKSQKENQNTLAGDTLSLSKSDTLSLPKSDTLSLPKSDTLSLSKSDTLSLPKWEVKKLGEVCEVIAGQSPEGKFYNTVGEGVPFYQGKKEYGEKYIGDPKTWTTKVTKEAHAGDILMSVRAPVGPVNFATQKICIGRGLASIRAGDLIDKEFLFYFLNNKEKELEGNLGAVFNSINKEQIKQIPIPLPPLPEQKKIVEVLDQAFAGIEQSRQNTKQNLKNAKEIFESYLKGVFENKGDDWEEKKLGEVCEFQRGLTYSKKDEVDFSDNIVLRSNNVDLETHKLIFDDLKYIDSSIIVPENKKVQKGALIICTANGSKSHLGKVALIEEDYNFYFGGFMGLIKPQEDINSKFLFYLMISNEYKKFIHALADGANINNLKFSDLSNFPIPLPPLAEQKKIVEELDALKTQTEALEQIYTQKLNALDELQKSLLQKAFAGEL